MSLIELIKSNTELKASGEIAFFGGSFNPWHPGHKACVKLMPNDIPLVILPDHNPYKEVVTEKINPSMRIKEDITELEGTKLIYDGFLLANKKNPTSHWIQELKNEFPNKRFSLLMGFDSFMSIDRWIDGENLLNNLAALYVASRLEDSSEKEKQTRRLKAIAPHLKIKFLGHHPYEQLSSTKLRES